VGVDPAPVVGAHLALDQAVLLQTGDHARQRALREVDVVGQLLDAGRLTALGAGQAIEHLELADAEAVTGLELALERGRHPGVALEQVTPVADQLGVLAGGSHAPNGTRSCGHILCSCI
jgi:hypothetical protein